MKTVGQLVKSKTINAAEAGVAHRFRFEPALWSAKPVVNLPSTHADRVARRGDKKHLVVR